MGTSPQYQGKVVFVGETVDDIGFRNARWWTAMRVDVPDADDTVLPLSLVDSGFRYASGRGASESGFTRMVDAALAQPPLVEIDAWQERVGVSRDLRMSGRIRNVSQVTLGYDNFAALSLLAYERKRVLHVDWYVRAGLEVPLEDDLPPGATMWFDHTIADLPQDAQMSRIQGLVLLDYRPDPKGPFLAAQAAVAAPGRPPATAIPSATPDVTPVASPVATAGMPFGIDLPFTAVRAR